MQQITRMRKAVCTMANELKKDGYSLTAAFRKAWKRVKLSMTTRATGVTFENRQKRLEFLKQFRPSELRLTLEREADSRFDNNAIQVVVHILSLSRRTVIGYVPKGLAKELAKVMDAGIPVKASMLQIIGGYSYKEYYGALINIAI